MSELRVPGIHVEEISFRTKSIENVDTTVTGFVGSSRFGPVMQNAGVITSLSAFEQFFGGGQQLNWRGSVCHNYLWHGVRSFFAEGGKRLHIARVFRPQRSASSPETPTIYSPPSATFAAELAQRATSAGDDDGHGRCWISAPSPATPQLKPPSTIPLPIISGGRGIVRVPHARSSPTPPSILIRARFPGEAGNLKVRFSLLFSPNSLVGNRAKNILQGIVAGDFVWIGSDQSGTSGSLLVANPTNSGDDWFFSRDGTAATAQFWLNQSPRIEQPKLDASTQRVRPVTLSVEVTSLEGTTQRWDGLPLHPEHKRAGTADSLTARFGVSPIVPKEALTLPIEILVAQSVSDASIVFQALFASGTSVAIPTAVPLSVLYTLSGGNDGERPGASDYAGTNQGASKIGLRSLEAIEDIAIVAAPGATYNISGDYSAEGLAIARALIGHAEQMRYRFAVLDSGNGQTINEVRAFRRNFDSKYAALYYPWIRTVDPITKQNIFLPPSGSIAGVYARCDIERGSWKAPANEVLNQAIGFEQTLNMAQQDILCPEGINCLRFFDERGYRVWGARTISSNPEWKYLSLCRYFCFLEHSINSGTRWAVFEPNGENLWANVRQTIEDFLLNQWQIGALLGDKPGKAFFVKCDRSTMTQTDIDNGRLVCLVGVAPAKPAEFMIFRIGQWTADRKG